MSESTTTAIFVRDFDYFPRHLATGWRIKASDKPQSFPRHVIKAALEAGAAKPLPRRRPAKS